MLNFQDLPDEIILKILSYVSGFTFNPIPTGNGLFQSICNPVTQTDMNRVKIRKALNSSGQVSKRIRNISRDGTLLPPLTWVCFVRNCNKEVKRIFFHTQIFLFEVAIFRIQLLNTQLLMWVKFFSQRVHFKRGFFHEDLVIRDLGILRKWLS